MLRCSAAAISKNAVAAAIARPARATCLLGRRERTPSSSACFDCRRKREHEKKEEPIICAYFGVSLGTLLKPAVTAVVLNVYLARQK